MKKTIISLLALVFIYSCTPQDAPITFTDSRDGKVYKTVTIGEQVWMAENLAFLPSVVGPATSSTSIAYYYVYDYNGTNVAEAKATATYRTYGVLYNWPAAMNGAASSSSNPSFVQGICPPGWHLPSPAEWIQLSDYLGGKDVAGGKMKETGTTHWYSPNEVATNSSGFKGLPGGFRNFYAPYFRDIGYSGAWWSTKEYLGTYGGCSVDLSRTSGSFYESFGTRDTGYSVRCVRN